MNETKCIDCDEETIGGETNNYYMLKNNLWKKYGTKNGKGFICKTCIEKRMGRALTRDDLNESIASKIFAESWNLK